MDDPNELLRGCQRGDESALTVLVQRFGGRVFRLACRMLGDAGRAEEAAADVFAKLWRSAGQWRGDAEAGTWIYRIAYRTILDHQRRVRPPVVPPPADLLDPRPGPFEQSIKAENRQRAERRIQKSMSELSEADRALVHLFYFEELPLAEIGVIFGATRDVLKMRLARARQRLRDLLGDEDSA